MGSQCSSYFGGIMCTNNRYAVHPKKTVGCKQNIWKYDTLALIWIGSLYGPHSIKLFFLAETINL